MEESLRQLFAALGRIPSGLFILTARRGAQETGVLVSWVQQCAFDPPHVSVVLRRGRPIDSWLLPGTRFILNILDDSQTDMVAHFGRGFELDEPAFVGLEVERHDSQAPILSESLAFLHCQVAGRCPVGEHDLLIAQVFDGRVLNEGHPLVHIRKSGAHY